MQSVSYIFEILGVFKRVAATVMVGIIPGYVCRKIEDVRDVAQACMYCNTWVQTEVGTKSDVSRI